MNDQQHSSADALTEQTELSAEAGRADTGEPASGVKAQDGFQVGSKSVPMKSVDAISAEGFSMDSRREVSGIDGMAVAEELRKAAIQFHNLTHGDPTVIIRPPSAEKRDAIIAAGKRLRRAILATSANETGAEGATWRAGVEAVAKMIEKKAADYLDEYGYVERDTGAVSWGSGNHADAKRDYHSSLVELAEEVRAMVPAMAAAAPADPLALSAEQVRLQDYAEQNMLTLEEAADELRADEHSDRVPPIDTISPTDERATGMPRTAVSDTIDEARAFARAILAASPVSQPAAAPIDPTDPGYDVETLREHIRHLERRVRQLSAPSPADERAALAKLRAEMFDWLASCTKEHIDGKIEFINRVTEGFAAIYARSAASPAAHVAPFKISAKAAEEWAVRHFISHVLKNATTQRAAIEDARTLHLLDSQQPAQADTIQCQAHSGPDCTECGGTGIWPAQADARAPWPMLAPLHLEAIVFAYNEGYSKAYDGRSFPNPFAESGSQAAAWVLGTRDGNEARVKSEQPPAQADAPAEAREPSKLLAEVWDSALEQAKTNPALLAKLRAAIGSATADAGEARLTDDLRTEFEWCLAEGNIGPRTRAAIQRLLNGAEQ